jgi:hypothetical protein
MTAYLRRRSARHTRERPLLPPAFHNRPSRGFRLRAPPEVLPYPILRGLPRPL